MSTRSDIIVQRADDKWARIYCHWDGYLANNGLQAEALGDMSNLGTEIGVKHDFDWGMKHELGTKTYKKYHAMCTVYGRDRGEKGVEARIGDTLRAVWPEEDTWTEFTYVWRDGKWWVGDPDEGTQTLVDLGETLLGKKIITPKVKMFGGIVLGKHAPYKVGKPRSWRRTAP